MAESVSPLMLVGIEWKIEGKGKWVSVGLVSMCEAGAWVLAVRHGSRSPSPVHLALLPREHFPAGAVEMARPSAVRIDPAFGVPVDPVRGVPLAPGMAGTL